MDPDLEAIIPDGHSSQVRDPVFDAKEPGAQASHEAAPALD